MWPQDNLSDKIRIVLFNMGIALAWQHNDNKPRHQWHVASFMNI